MPKYTCKPFGRPPRGIALHGGGDVGRRAAARPAPDRHVADCRVGAGQCPQPEGGARTGDCHQWQRHHRTGDGAWRGARAPVGRAIGGCAACPHRGQCGTRSPSCGEAIGIWLRSKPAIRDSVVLRARRYLQQHLREPFDLEKFAAAASTSERTLLRHFAKTVGTSPLQLLHRLRVARACHLLEVSTLSLTAIASSAAIRTCLPFGD